MGKCFCCQLCMTNFDINCYRAWRRMLRNFSAEQCQYWPFNNTLICSYCKWRITKAPQKVDNNCKQVIRVDVTQSGSKAYIQLFMETATHLLTGGYCRQQKKPIRRVTSCGWGQIAGARRYRQCFTRRKWPRELSPSYPNDSPSEASDRLNPPLVSGCSHPLESRSEPERVLNVFWQHIKLLVEHLIIIASYDVCIVLKE